MSDTRLRYAITPDTVITGSLQTLTFTAENPADGTRITFAAGARGDEILLTIPAPPAESGASALTDKVDCVAQSATDGFIAGLQPGGNAITIRPTDAVILPPGGRIEVTLSNIQINAVAGAPVLTVDEYIGNDSGKATLTMTKRVAGLTITAWLDRQLAGQDQPVTLYWQSTGGTVVEVTGLDGGTGARRFPVSGKVPPYPGQISFLPRQPGSQTLTLTVRTGDGMKSATTGVTLDVRSPFIGSLSADPPGDSAIAADQSVSLDWSVLYARAAILTPPSAAGPRQVPAQPLRALVVQPGLDAIDGAASPSDIPQTVDYILTATGFAPQAEARLSFTLKPVRFLYFKYLLRRPDGSLANPSYALDPADWSAFQMVLSTVNSFTLFQPGGTSGTWYLGAGDTTHPQILYFDTADAPKDGKVTLVWQSANLNTLVLDPGGQKITGTDIAKGQLQVEVPKGGECVLTGTSASGEVVTSVLNVSPDGDA